MKIVLTTRTKIALARLVQRPLVTVRSLAGCGSMVRVRRGGIAWNLDLEEGIDFSIWLLGAFERRTVAAYSRVLGPGMIALDIGANVGAHTLPLARQVGANGQVIAFEPTRWAMNKLQANVAANPELAPRIVCSEVLLVDDGAAPIPESLPASWPVAGGSDVHPKLRGRAMSIASAKAMTLDACVGSLALRRIDFIKLDVDGHECMVLRGARETLRRFRPVIVTEVSPYILSERNCSVEELIHLLRDAGYRFFDLVSAAPLPSSAEELSALVPDGGGINVLCRVSE